MIERAGNDIKSFDGDVRGAAATFFAAPDRAPPEVVQDQASWAEGEPLLAALFDSLHEPALLLNRERQIVFANRAFRESRGENAPGPVLGMRPGEAIGCLHALAAETPNGCGTSRFCCACGAALAILASQQKGAAEEDVRIVLPHQVKALNLRVRTRRIELRGDPFTLFVVQNMSDQRRREELEHLFFHDVQEMASNLRAMVGQLPVVPAEQRPSVRSRILGEISRLIAVTDSRRLIAKAERNELSCTLTPIDALDVLRTCSESTSRRSLGEGRSIALDPSSGNVQFVSDWNLVVRVLTSAIEDAISSAPPEATVTLGCRREADEVRFEISHPFAVPSLLGPEIFRDSSFANGENGAFEASGMGIIAERCLHGRLSLTSDEEQGTVFAVSFPAAQTAGVAS